MGKHRGLTGCRLSLTKILDFLAPLLLDMFNHSLSIGTLPKTLTEASILVIPITEILLNAVPIGLYHSLMLMLKY